jgi:hypothetical protein
LTIALAAIRIEEVIEGYIPALISISTFNKVFGTGESKYSVPFGAPTLVALILYWKRRGHAMKYLLSNIALVGPGTRGYPES